MTGRAQTYGEALYELCRDEKLSGDVLQELQMTADIFGKNPDFVRLLSLPSVPKAERCGLLDESFGGRVHPYTLSFLKLLVENGVIRELASCEKAYRRRYNEDSGILEVTAVTAVPLTPELREKLAKKLASATGKCIDLTCRVDQDLLGGMRVEMAGKRYDGTVRSRLAELQKSLDSLVL